MRASLLPPLFLAVTALLPAALEAAYGTRPYGYGSNLGNYGVHNARRATPRKQSAQQRTPCLAGSTGIVDLPSAYMQSSMTSWAEDGRVVNHFNVASQGYEMGAKISEGNWAKHFKYLLSPETRTKNSMFPAVAVGVLDSGSAYAPRKYFLVTSTTLGDAGTHLHWGLTREKDGSTASYWGLDFPLSTTFFFRGEYDHRADVWNLGIEYTLSDAITAFRYMRDYRDRHPDSDKDGDITGICYRKSF